MAKDPAFLFYPNDYIGGTMGMTFEEKGAYMELLMMQFNRGHMTSHMIGQVIGQIWVNIQHKFKQDKDGLWFNERLDEEIKKRKSFTESRKNNLTGTNQYTKNKGHMRGHMTSHMENENENVNIDVNEDKKVFNELKKLFLQEFELRTGQPYYFTAKCAKNLKQIQRKVENLLRNKGHTVDFENVVSSFMLLISSRKNKWINENFSIPIINLKFNETIAGLTTTGTSDREFAEVLAKHLGD
jgi:uncharacterized protein YdaU (DUF1376 family)